MDELELQAEKAIDRLLEREIRDYVAKNLHLIAPGLKLVGVEHAVPFGRIDVLAMDGNFNYTVIELKRGVATRDAIGQLQSYMGAIQQEVPGSDVAGVLIAKGLDPGAKAALSICKGIDFVQYAVEFTFAAPNSKQPSKKVDESEWAFPTGNSTPQQEEAQASSTLDAAAAWPK